MRRLGYDIGSRETVYVKIFIECGVPYPIFFSITNCNSDKDSVEELLCGVDMDRADDRRPDMDLQDTYDTRQVRTFLLNSI